MKTSIVKMNDAAVAKVTGSTPLEVKRARLIRGRLRTPRGVVLTATPAAGWWRVHAGVLQTDKDHDDVIDAVQGVKP